jgi:hypothetical protein
VMISQLHNCTSSISLRRVKSWASVPGNPMLKSPMSLI